MTHPPRSPSLPVAPLSSTDGPPRYARRVVVATQASVVDAEMVRSRLGAAGIAAGLLDEHTVGMASYLSNAVGGIKVTVAEGDEERARATLRSAGQGGTAFRLLQTRAASWGLGGCVAGWAGAAVASLSGLEVTTWWSAAALATGAGVGAWLGRRAPWLECSEPSCAHALTPDDNVCPGCGRTLLGTIRHRDERLAAEEALSGAASDDGGDPSASP